MTVNQVSRLTVTFVIPGSAAVREDTTRDDVGVFQHAL